MTVLDASALLAFLFREPGGDAVRPLLHQGFISTVNHSEVLARFARDGRDITAVDAGMASVGLRVVDFQRDHACIAATLVGPTRSLGLSLGDRACLALGLALGAPVLTADRAWLALDGWQGLEVRAIR